MALSLISPWGGILPYNISSGRAQCRVARVRRMTVPALFSPLAGNLPSAENSAITRSYSLVSIASERRGGTKNEDRCQETDSEKRFARGASALHEPPPLIYRRISSSLARYGCESTLYTSSFTSFAMTKELRHLARSPA